MSTIARHTVVNDEAASTRLSIRIAPKVKAQIRKAAKLRKFSLSDFIVRSSQEAAEAFLAEQTRFVLPEKQWKAFHAALDAPAKKIPALRRLLTEPSVFNARQGAVKK